MWYTRDARISNVHLSSNPYTEPGEGVRLTERTQGRVGQTGDADAEVDAGAVGAGGGGDGAADVGPRGVRHGGGVGDADGVGVHDEGIAQLAGGAGHDGAVDGAVDEGLRADDGDAEESGGDSGGSHDDGLMVVLIVVVVVLAFTMKVRTERELYRGWRWRRGQFGIERWLIIRVLKRERYRLTNERLYEKFHRRKTEDTETTTAKQTKWIESESRLELGLLIQRASQRSVMWEISLSRNEIETE